MPPTTRPLAWNQPVDFHFQVHVWLPSQTQALLGANYYCTWYAYNYYYYRGSYYCEVCSAASHLSLMLTPGNVDNLSQSFQMHKIVADQNSYLAIAIADTPLTCSDIEDCCYCYQEIELSTHTMSQ